MVLGLLYCSPSNIQNQKKCIRIGGVLSSFMEANLREDIGNYMRLKIEINTQKPLYLDILLKSKGR